MCGRAGVCALGAVVAKYAGDTRSLTHYLNHFKEVDSLNCLFLTFVTFNLIIM